MSSLWLILLTLILAVYSPIYFPSMKKSYPVYQWSSTGTFANASLVFSKNGTFINSTATTMNCSLIINQIDHVVAKGIIDQLPNDTDCVLIQVNGVSSDLDRWIIPSTVLNTNFPVAVMYTATPPSGFLSGVSYPATFEGWDANFYFTSYWIRVAFYIVLFILNFACMCWGLFRLLQRFQHNQLQFNISTVCITLETISCVFRCMVSIMHFIYYGLPWYDINTHLDKMFNYMGFPFSLASGIFLIFFWIDITSDSLYKGAFLDKFFWPAFLFSVASFIVVDAGAILSVLYANVTFVNQVGEAADVIILIIGIIYYIAAYKVYLYAKERKEIRNNLMRITYKVMLGGLLTILIGVFSFITVSAGTNLNLTIAMQDMIILIFVCRSAVLIEIFHMPKIKSDSNPTPDTKSLELPSAN